MTDRSFWLAVVILIPLASPALASLAGRSTAAGGVRTYPAAAPCDTTLQACVDAAEPGDVVEIATDDPIAESVTIDKSLTLVAAVGYRPTLVPEANVLLVNRPGAASVIVVDGLTLERGKIHAIQASELPFVAAVRRNVLIGERVGIVIGDEFRTAAGAVSFDIEGNEIRARTAASGEAAIAVHAGDFASLRGTIHANVIRHVPGHSVSAIEVSNRSSRVDVDVFRNEVRVGQGRKGTGR